MSRTVHVFLNRTSGSAGGVQDHIVEGFRASGLSCTLTALEPGVDVAALAGEAARRTDTIVVAAGGDGTVNAVASGVRGTGGTLGVLPVGTLNHFARDLGIPADLGGAMEVIAHGERCAVDLGEVNGRVFVNNSSVGIYTDVVRHRMRLQRSGLSKWFALVVASVRALIRFRHLSVRLNIDGREILRKTPIVFVGNNEYTVEGTSIGCRSHLDRGKLFVYLTPGLTRIGVFRMAFAALFGRVKDVSNYEQFCVSELSVSLRRRVCRVSLDGEVRGIAGPLRYSIRPAALHVCAPAPPAAEE